MKIHGTAKGGALSKKDFGVAFGGGAITPVSELISKQTAYDSKQNSPTYQGWIFKLESSTYQDKTITSFTLKHENVDGTASGNVSLKLYPIGENPWDSLGDLIGSMGIKAVPSGTTTEDVEFTDSVTVPSAGAWMLLDLSGVTNEDKYAVWATESAEPAEYDPWLECFKFKSDDSVVDSGADWYYSISGYE